jgi:elongation factor 1-gamma
MADLRLFSYSPNPRVWKATIAARFCEVNVETRGASGRELREWLWDYDARPLAKHERQSLSSLVRTGRVGLTGAQLFKTDAFLEAQPFGNVPAAFGPDGKIGIFESNSIMRAVARLGEPTFPLYGCNLYEASRIDSFLDVSLIFARDSQIYLLALSAGTVDAAIHARAKEAFAIYASGLEQALSPQRETFVGKSRSPTSALLPSHDRLDEGTRWAVCRSLAKVICVPWQRENAASVFGGSKSGAVYAVYQNSDHARLGEGVFRALRQ